MKRTLPTRRRGFTLLEVLVVATLTTFLATLLAAVWAGLGRPMTDAMASIRLTQEANLAAASLQADFGGTLPESAARIGSATLGQWVGRMQPLGAQLRLCFDGGTPDGIAEWASPDTVITYYVDEGKLVRWNELDGTTFVVARYVNHLELVDEGGAVQIKIQFSYRHLSRTYTFVGFDP